MEYAGRLSISTRRICSKWETLIQYCFSGGPPSATLSHQLNSIGCGLLSVRMSCFLVSLISLVVGRGSLPVTMVFTSYWHRSPANKRHPPDAGLMLGQRRRLWPNINTALDPVLGMDDHLQLGGCCAGQACAHTAGGSVRGTPQSAGAPERLHAESGVVLIAHGECLLL